MPDSVSSPELDDLYMRLSARAYMKGATNAREIEKRMQEAIDTYRTIVKIERSADKPRLWRIKRAAYNADQLDRLVENDFPAAFIREAEKHPLGVIARGLYGEKEYRRRLRAQRMTRRTYLRAYPRVGVRFRGEELPRTVHVIRRVRVGRPVR